MASLFTSIRGTLRVDSALAGAVMRARVDLEDASIGPRLTALSTLERLAASDGMPVLSARSVESEGTAFTLACDRIEEPASDASYPWFVAARFVSGLCELATLLHSAAQPAFLGPPERSLLRRDMEGELLLPFPAIHGYVYAIERELRGAAMQIGHFKSAPEMHERTPVADVFFLTQFLVELVTGREPYRKRVQDPFGYLEELRQGPSLLSAAWPGIAAEVGAPPSALRALEAGLAADPKARLQTPAELAEWLRPLR